MRIAMVISNPFPPEEGIGYYVYNLSKKLIENGNEVTVFTRGTLRREFELYENINIIRAPFLPIYPFHVTFHGIFLNRILKTMENSFDIIHIHTPLVPSIKTSLPIVSTLHGSMVENSKNIQLTDVWSIFNKVLSYLLSYPLTVKLINKSKVVTSVSGSVTEELERYYGVEDVLVMGNGVNENEFFPDEFNSEAYILYVGRISHGKGLFDLLNSIKCLRNKNNLKLYIAGKGGLEKKVKNYIKKENLGNNIKLLGNLSHKNLVKVYQNASLFVFPSYYEGFPTVVLEAMSSGLPVIISNIPAHRSFIINNYNGLFFEKGSIVDLSEKINFLLKNKDLKQKLGRNARITIEDNFTWDKIGKEYEKIYKKVLN